MHIMLNSVWALSKSLGFQYGCVAALTGRQEAKGYVCSGCNTVGELTPDMLPIVWTSTAPIRLC